MHMYLDLGQFPSVLLCILLFACGGECILAVVVQRLCAGSAWAHAGGQPSTHLSNGLLHQVSSMAGRAHARPLHGVGYRSNTLP